MIINQETIKHAVLYQTLFNQIQRLRRICNHSNLSTISNKILQSERKIIMLQYQYQNKREQAEKRETDLQLLFRQLCQTKVLSDRERNTKIQNNRSFLADLRSQRQNLKKLQKNLQNLEQQRAQLQIDITRKGQQINRIKLRKQDEYEQLNSQNVAILSCRQQINKVNRSLTAIKSQQQYQQNLLKQSKKDNKSLKNQLGQTRRVWIDKSNITEKERNLFVKQTEVLNQQWAGLTTQKENKSLEIEQIKCKITQINTEEDKLAKSISFLKNEIQKIEEGIVKQIKVTQEIQTLIFQTKVNRSDLKNRNIQDTKKLERLKTLKNSLLDLLVRH